MNGKWQYIVDPYETGYYDYRFKERKENDPEAFWTSGIQRNKTERKEHGYSNEYVLDVPGDWNHQKPEFLYYEGTLWYKKTFDFDIKLDHRHYIYFGAVNYRADVYLNGKKLGTHLDGFTPFNFEIPENGIKAKDNLLVVKVDNKRGEDEVPTLNTDWWNYGGITREVKILEVPQTFIRDFSLQLKKVTAGKVPANKPTVEGWVKVDGIAKGKTINIEIPELGIKKEIQIMGDSTAFDFQISKVRLWSPEDPKLYKVKLILGTDVLEDKVGFRTIEAYGKQVLLNGKPIFMRGISIHGEVPTEVRRAYSEEDAKLL